MALALKVAGSSPRRSGKQAGGPTLGPIEKRYQVMGFWPRYEVMVMWKDETRQVIWGRKKLKAWEVAMRMDGCKRYKPKSWKK